jgi:hypothetical protein
MMNIDQIKEIKKGVTHSKLALWQALHDLMTIEEVDLTDDKAMTLDRMSEVRKKLTLTRGLIGTRLNPLFELLHAFMTDSLDKKG